MRLRFYFSNTAILLTAIAIAAWLAVEVSRIRAKQRAIEMIESLGGTVVYDYQWSDKVWQPNAVPPGHAWLHTLLGDHYAAEPVEIQLFKERGTTPELFTDSQARQVALLRELRWLVLMNTGLTDIGLEHFKALKNLERLDVEWTQVTDEGAASLRKALPQVRIYHGIP